MIGFGIFDVLYNTRKGNLVKETGIEEFEEDMKEFLQKRLTNSSEMI